MTDQYLTEKKLRQRIDELKAYRFIQTQALDKWEATEDTSKEELYPPKKWDFELSVGETWTGRDRYIWVRKEIDVPTSENNWLLIDFGRTGGGYNSGFESLMFINGEPYQGVDSNHKEVYINPKYCGSKIEVSLKLWSGLEGGGEEVIQVHDFKQAELSVMHNPSDDLFFTSDIMLKTIACLKENDSTRYALMNCLEKAFFHIDWSYAGSDSFYASVAIANNTINQGLEQIPKFTEVLITVIGHTHIDVAWLWRLKHTEEKSARSFSTVLRLMEQYPEYAFLQTQPQLYKFIKRSYPEIYSKIKEKIAEGRWEVDGAMWLEADCNIPSGESLTRQILYGKKFVKDEFGKDMHYLWLPDVFGYSWALPQILKKSGISTFMTTKISWNQYNRMPHDTFNWKGMDGSEVLTHFVTTPPIEEANDSKQSWFYTYNGELEPSVALGTYNGYSDKKLNNELLISYGYGDGGGGVTRDMLENRRRMDKMPGLPNMKQGFAKDYFDRLHQTLEENYYETPKWDGELYLEYHRGTYTSQAFVKKMNRKIELALREIEILYSLTGKEYPHDTIDEIWEVLLRNQFHDIIPGSSIKEVYADHKVEMENVCKMLDSLRSEFLSDSSKLFNVINTSSWMRNSVAKVELPEEGHFTDSNGNQLLSTFDGNNHYVLVENIKQFANETIRFEDGLVNATKQVATLFESNTLETDFYQISWNDAGQLTQLFDKELKREVLKGSGNVLQLFEDKPLNFDAWDIDVFYQEKGIDLTASQITLKDNNSLVASVVFDYQFGNSTITQEMRLYSHSKRIDFVTNVHWEERQQLLKAKFEVDVRSTEATYDIQYGNVKRPTHNNTSWDFAQFESVGHQWADLSETYFGVSLLNDSKYGYDIYENNMRLTLLKGGIYPDPTADIGDHQFTYSLFPHSNDFIEGKTVEEAWEINSPLTVLSSETIELPELSIDSEVPVVVDAIKEAEDKDGLILRLHDQTGGTRRVKLSLENSDIEETNLMEDNLGIKYSNTADIMLHPYEIRTFRIRR